MPPPPPPQNSTNARAFVAAAAQSPSSSNWYVDSSATDQITNDLNNLQLYEPYYGNEQVTVDNGSSIPIQHTGKGLLPTTNLPLKLNHVLYVPRISSNLVSVHQLTSNYNCTITFDSDSFTIQAKIIKKALCKGPHLHGLYQLPCSKSVSTSASSPSACLASKNSSFLWHKDWDILLMKSLIT